MEQSKVPLIKIIVVSILTCFCVATQGQRLPFDGGLYGGFTTSQINGDETDGFHRIGGTGGIFVETTVANAYKPTFELGFSQKGSADKNHSFKITTGYVDAALLLKMYPTNLKNPGSKLHSLGLYAGPLLSVKAYENLIVNDLTQKTKNFGRFDLQLCGGLEYALLESLKLDIRCTYSILKINEQYRNFALYFLLRWNPFRW